MSRSPSRSMRPPSRQNLAVALLAVAFAGTLASRAGASERRFTYTYDSNVLNPGDFEIEPWTTYRYGRERFYSRMDNRLELEWGVARDLQSALYWNFTALAADSEVAPGVIEREREFEFKGISWEWKYKLTDAVADALGSGLYFEATGAPAEAELEGKVILDKRFGDALIAFNAVVEHEWEFESRDETKRELELQGVAGFSYQLSPNVAAGLELRSHTELANGEYEHTAFFAGPTLSYAHRRWWGALTFLPQIAAHKQHEEAETGGSSSRLDLEEHERLEIRLLLGFHL